MNNDHFGKGCHNLLALEGTFENIIHHCLPFVGGEAKAWERESGQGPSLWQDQSLRVGWGGAPWQREGAAVNFM